jgi:predicted branched-subunit amino acid permease
VQWPAWVAGTALGVALAPDAELLHTLGLDVLTPALFVMLLLDELTRERTNRLPAALGAAIAAGLLLVMPAGPALIGAALAALVALVKPSPRPAGGPDVETGEQREPAVDLGRDLDLDRSRETAQ